MGKPASVAIRWVPLARKLGAADPAQVAVIVRTLTASLTPELTRSYVAQGQSLWRHHLSAGERASFHEIGRSHRGVIRKVQPADVWDAIEVARADLHAVLCRDGGRAWLHDQTLEIKAALLQ